MSQAKKELLDDEYLRLKKFFLLFSDRYMGFEKIPESARPSTILRELEQTSPAKAKKGLLMAINDAMEVSSDWSPAKVASLDAELKEKGAALLAELRRRYSKKYLSLLKRKSIRTEKEYYFLKGVVDGGSIEQGATEGEQLQAMMSDFERRLVEAQKQKPPASK